MDLETILKGVDKLPPTPQILPKLQSLLMDVNSSMFDIVSLLKIDAPMTAQIVRMSNSAYYGSRQRSQNLEEAINRVGFSEVYKLVSLAASKQVLGEAIPLYRMDSGELLHVSVSCAVLMVELASRSSGSGLNLDTAYTIGLLHGLGKVIVNKYYLAHGIEVYNSESDDLMEPDTERKLLGFDSGDAGAALLQKWNFPVEIYEPIKYQYRPHLAEFEKPSAYLLYLAKYGAEFMREENPEATADCEPVEEQLEATQLTEDDFRECLSYGKQGFSEVQSLITTMN